MITSYERARKGVKKQGGDLRFHRWDGTGKVTVRFQYGLTVGSVYGGDTRLQIDPVESSAWTSPERSLRRKLARTKVRIRVGTNQRAPVWLELPLILHRPMPDSGVIRAASVIRESIGGRDRWRLLVTVDRSPGEPRSGLPVGIDLGVAASPRGFASGLLGRRRGRPWRVTPEKDLLWEFSKLKEIQSAQKRDFIEIRQALQDWSATSLLPAWMDLSPIERWTAPHRLLQLYTAWKDQRFHGDSPPFSILENWRRRYFDRSAWSDNLRDQVRRHRREVYRRFVSGLLQSHGRVYIEDLDIRALSKSGAPGSRVLNVGAPMRVVATPSLLQKLLEEKGACTRVDPSFSTQQCSWCGHCAPWDTALNLTYKCQGCGTLFDQDRNAARNILHRGIALKTA